MNKTFKSYSVIWIIVFLLFNVIAFVTPSEVNGISKFTGGFWAGYIFVMLAFIGQLICAYFAFKAENTRKLFYNIPLIRISYIGLVVMLIAGALAMSIPSFPVWLAIIVCCMVLAFAAIGVISTSHAAKTVENIDAKTRLQTNFIRSATMQAKNLTNRARDPEIKRACEKLYKALRYSDPVSNAHAYEIEIRITEEMDSLAKLVSESKSSEVNQKVQDITILVSERNEKIINKK